MCVNLEVLRKLCEKLRCFLGKVTQLAQILHDRWSWRSRQISTLLICLYFLSSALASSSRPCALLDILYPYVLVRRINLQMCSRSFRIEPGYKTCMHITPVKHSVPKTESLGQLLKQIKLWMNDNSVSVNCEWTNECECGSAYALYNDICRVCEFSRNFALWAFLCACRQDVYCQTVPKKIVFMTD